MGRRKRKKKDERKNGKTLFSENPHTGGGGNTAAASADTLPPRGMEKAIQTTKQEQNIVERGEKSLLSRAVNQHDFESPTINSY